MFWHGAIGGYLAAELALAGHEVSAIVRGTHLDAIRENGLKLIIEGKEKVARIAASFNSSDFGPQDYVICTLKAHQSHESAEQFRPLLGAETAVVTAMNGIPWWYFYKEGGRFDGRHLESVDSGQAMDQNRAGARDRMRRRPGLRGHRPRGDRAS